MKEIIVEIKNDQGVHARPSGQIVNIAKKYDVALEIEKVFEKALDDGLTKVDVKEIIEIVLGERDYGNKAK